MKIGYDNQTIHSIGLLKMFGDNLREMLLFTKINGIVNNGNKKIYLIVNRDTDCAKFVLHMTGESSDVYYVVTIRNIQMFPNYHTVLELNFDNQHTGFLELSFTKYFLIDNKVVPERDISISQTNNIDINEIQDMYNNCYAEKSERLMWTYLLIDSGMQDVNRATRLRTVLLSHLSEMTNRNDFFSVVQFGELIENSLFNGKYVTNDIQSIREKISMIGYHPGNLNEADLFNNIFASFSKIKKFSLKYFRQLDLRFGIIMLTDGRQFNESILNGFCAQRDKLNVAIFNIDNFEKNSIIATICNVYDWDSFEKN